MAQKLTIKLIHCGNKNLSNAEDSAPKNIFFIPVGLFALADILNKEGHDIEIIHSDLLEHEDLRKIINFEELDMVGFDCHWANQGLAVMGTAQMIKEIKPSVFIFLGGYTASFFGQEIVFDYPQIDAVIRGDGEVPIARLCREYMKPECAGARESDLSNVPNLIWRNAKGQLMENDFSYIGGSEHMERLDYASIELLRNWQLYRDLSKFWTNHKPLGTVPLFLLAIGRGCCYACTFCGGNCEAQKEISNREVVSVRSYQSVLKTIKKARIYGYECFYSGYEFPDSDPWYVSLLKAIKQEQMQIDFVYGAFSLPSKAIIDALAECARSAIIEISPETYDEALRKKNKDLRLFYENARLEECLDYISGKKNVKVQLYFGYFLPFDTEETIMNTIHYILKLLKKYPGLIEIEYSNFSTDPASRIYLHPDEYEVEICVKSFNDYIEFIKKKYLNSNPAEADMRIFHPRGMTDTEREKMELRIKFMSYLFSWFRSSLSYIFHSTGETEWLKEVVCSWDEVMESGNFSSQKTMELLISVLNKEGFSTLEILGMVVSEYQERKSQSRLFQKGPNFWLEPKNSEFGKKNKAKGVGTEIKLGPCQTTDEPVIEFDL